MNPEKINILMLPLWTHDQWGQGRTFQQVAEHLAARPEVHRVVCLFQPLPVSRRYHFPLRMQRAGSKLFLMRTYGRAVPMDCRPYRLRRWINDHIQHSVRLALALLGFRPGNTILWAFPPLGQEHLGAAFGNFPHRLCVTQIVDNFMALEGESERPARELAAIQYPMLAARSDLVVTGSSVMFDYFSALNRDTLLMENGVDSRFIGVASELPCRLDGAPPRLGYVGYISSRTDIELLECVARSRPEWTLVVAGALHEVAAGRIAALLALPNVDYLGEVPYHELPALIKSFDVCLIAHKDTPLSRSMSPLKFFQYLGSGRPIVTTPIAGIERFAQYCHVGNSCAEFVSRIEAALKTCTMESSRQRILAAGSETWETRIDQVFLEVAGRFRKKSHFMDGRRVEAD